MHFGQMTEEERAEFFIEHILLDKDDPPCEIDMEFWHLEHTYLRDSWHVVPVMTIVFDGLRKRSYDLQSRRGYELLRSLARRIRRPDRWGHYATTEVTQLRELFLANSPIELDRINID